MSIVAAIDETRGSTPVVTVANDLANAFDEPLVVVHVAPAGVAELDYSGDMVPLEPGMDADEKAAVASEFAADVANASLTEDDMAIVEPIGRVGAPVEEVLAVADDRDARFLVIGGRKRSPTSKAVFGSNTQTILLRAECPTVTVKR